MPRAPSVEPALFGEIMNVYYIEIVTADVDTVCKTHELLHGLEFGEPLPGLGGARTAKRAGGGLIGVRAPLRDNEDPITRHYVLVDDIEAVVTAVAEAGAEVAVPPMELPGHGVCAITIQGGIESGFWQL